MRKILFCLLALYCLRPALSDADSASAYPHQNDLTRLPLEQLLELEVMTASRIAQQVSDAPSAVSIVTAREIHDYGYRTLAEILNSMRGLYITHDRVYDFLGGRGYGRPGDYSGRIMLLIDGVQVNDNVYNQSYLGHDGLLDTALIERVEYISGPGSVTYGNNAYFGIINVITKKGSDFNGAQLALAGGSYHTRHARATYGAQLENGIDLLVSASGLNSDGQDFRFPEFDDGDPAHNGGIARNLDGQRNQRLFGKVGNDQWHIEAGYVQRHKNIPTASYGTDFNTPEYEDDASKFIVGQFHFDVAEDLKLSLQSSYSDYIYRGVFPYAGENWIERAFGRRWDIDAKFAGNWFDGHKLVFGMSYRHDYQRKQTSPVMNEDHGMETWSLYVQDEIALSRTLWLNVGARYDHFSQFDDALAPRAALIYQPNPDWVLRLSRSHAYRTPTAYERYYFDDAIAANPDIEIEHVATTELVVERHWGSHARLLAALYEQKTRDMISGTPYSMPGPLYFENIDGCRARGLELEYERHWNGMQLRGSYAYQRSKDSEDDWAVNSPRQIAKFNISGPILANTLTAGFELQALSNRKSEAGNHVPGYALANLSLSTRRIAPGLDVSFTVRNLFDRKYYHAAPDYNTPLDALRQDGRNYWLEMVYGF